MQLTAKKVLWWSFLTGVGFTVGAGLVRVIYLALVWGLRIDLILPWLGGLISGQP